MQESTFRGVSIRALLAIGTVFSGLGFLYVMAFVAIVALQGEIAMQIGLSIVVAVISFINLALGYYLGQKNQVVVEDEPDTSGPYSYEPQVTYTGGVTNEDSVSGEPTG